MRVTTADFPRSTNVRERISRFPYALTTLPMMQGSHSLTCVIGSGVGTNRLSTVMSKLTTGRAAMLSLA